MDNRENFSALSTLSPGSNGVRSFSSPGGINGKRTPVTKKLIIKNLKVSPKISTYISWLYILKKYETNDLLIIPTILA